MSDTILLTAVVRDSAQNVYASDTVYWSSADAVVITPVDTRSAKLTFARPAYPLGVQSFTVMGAIRRPKPVSTTRSLFLCTAGTPTLFFTANIVVGRTSVITLDGDGVNVPTVTSSNPNVLAVDGTRATALQAGTVVLTASECGRTATRSANVLPTSAGYGVTPVNIPTSQPTRLRNNGQVVTWAAAAHTFSVWTNGSLAAMDLGVCVPVDVNDNNQVLCQGNGPVIWENGTATQRDTVTFVGTWGQQPPLGINNAGSVLGSAMIWRGPGDVVRAPCDRFRCEGTSAFNNRGDVLISGGSAPGGGISYLWRTDINFPYVVGGAVSALNDSADVGGSDFFGSYRANASESWVRRRLGPTDQIQSINNRGDVVGNDFIFDDRGASRIAALLGSGEYSIVDVRRINDARQILARAVRSGTTDTALVLLTRPVP